MLLVNTKIFLTWVQIGYKFEPSNAMVCLCGDHG
jgi:hypothetical protein